MKPVSPIAAVEQKLERMAPAPLSRHASRELDDLIDSLAIQGADTRARSLRWRAIGISAAAAAVLIGALAVTLAPGARSAARRVATIPPAVTRPGGEFIGLTNRVGDPEDGGVLADEDGGMHRVVRYQVVEEEVVRDPHSGVTVRVTEPREGIVLVPVSSF